jgi:hypothetical protein
MELIYLRSPTGQQHERARKVLDAIRSTMPELTIREVDPADDPGYAQRFKIKYAPGLIVDGRIEFVGIPREKMLLERLQLLAQASARPPRPAAATPVATPASAGMSPEERQRRIDEAKRRAEEAKRQREAASQAPAASPAPPTLPSPAPATPPPLSPEERQRKIEEARKKAEESKKQREATAGS